MSLVGSVEQDKNFKEQKTITSNLKLTQNQIFNSGQLYGHSYVEYNLVHLYWLISPHHINTER